MTNPGYARKAPSSTSLMIVAINGVDAASNTANGVTNRLSNVTIDLKYHVGAIQTTPSVGEQWFVKQISTPVDGTVWVLDSKIPFNSTETTFPATEGQTQVGNGQGPIQLHGSSINANAPIKMFAGNSPLPEATAVAGGSLAYDDTVKVPTFSDGDSWINLATALDVAAKYAKPAGGIPVTDLSSSVQAVVNNAYQKPSDGVPSTDLSASVQSSLADGSAAQGSWTTFLADMGVTTISQLATQLGTLTSGSSSDTVNWTSLFNSLGLGGVSDLSTWLSNLNTSAQQSSSNWTAFLTQLEQSTSTAAANFIAEVNTVAAQAQTNWNTLLNDLGLGSSSAFGTYVQNIETAANNAVTTGNYNTLLNALFGSTTVASTIHVGALPTGIPQTYISGLTTALENAVTTGNYNGLLQALFGSTTVGSTVQVAALPTSIPQTYISGLTSALNNAVTTGNYNGLLTALFGGTSVGSTVQLSAIPTNIPQNYVTGLVSALSNAVTTGNWNALLNALFGTTTVGSTIATSAVPSGISSSKINNVLGGTSLGADLTALNKALFGSTSTSVGTTLQPTAIPTITQAQVSGLSASLGALLPNTTWQTFINGLVGGTAGGVNDLINYINGIDTAAANAVTTGNYNGLLQALFGGTSVSSTIQTSAVPAGIAPSKISNVFGGSNLGADLAALSTALFGGSGTSVGSTVQTSALSSTLQAVNTNWTNLLNQLFGGQTIGKIQTASLSTILQGVETNWNSLLSNLFGGSSVGSTVQTGALPATLQTVNSNWTTLLNSLFGGSTVGSTVQAGALPSTLQTVNSNWTTLLTNLFTGGTISSAIQSSAVPALPTSKIASGTFSSTFFPMFTFGKAAGSNLVLDPGFENASAWAWQAAQSNGGSQSTAFAHGGTKSWKTVGVTALYMASTDTAAGTVHVSPGDIYQLGSWIYLPSTNTNTGTVYLDLNLSDSTGVHGAINTYSGVNLSTIPVNTWTQLKANLTVPAGYDTCNFLVWIPSAVNTDVFYHDDLVVREVTLAQSIISSLFSGGTVQSTVQATALPTTLQSVNSNWTTLLTNLFGGGSVGTTVQTSALSSTLQTVNSNWTSLLSQLFGSQTIGQVQTSSLSSTLQAVETKWTNLLNQLFGSQTVGSVQTSSLSTTLQGVESNWITLLTNLFGGSTVGSTVKTGALPATLQTVNTNWNSLLNQLFGSQTIGAIQTSSLSSVLQGVETNWNTLLTNLFGGSSVGSSIAASAVPSGISAAKISNVLGGSTLGADLTALANLLFGSATVGSSVQTSALSSTLQAVNTNWVNLLTKLFGSNTVGTTIQTGSLSSTLQAVETNWGNLLSNLFGGSSVASSVQTSALPSTLQTVNSNWNSLLNQLFGGQTIGTVQTSALSSLLQSVESGWTSLLGNLFPGGSIGATIQTSAVPSGISSTKISNLFGGSSLGADLQNLATALGLGSTVTPTSKINASSITAALNQGSLGADIAALGALFFPSNPTTVGTAVAPSALPNIAAGSGPGQSGDLLTHLNAVAAAAGTSGTTPVSAAAAGMQLITNTLADVSATLQSQNTQASGNTNTGQSFFLPFSIYQNWAAVPVNTTYGNIPGQSSHGSGTFTINSNGQAAWSAVNNGDVSGVAIFNNGGQQAFTNTDYQKLYASLGGLPNGAGSRNYALVRANSAGTDYVYGVIYLNSSYQLCWEVGCVIAGTSHTWASGTTSAMNLNFTMIAGVGNNPNRYQGYSGNVQVFDHTNVSGDPGGLYPVGSTHRYWGFRSDTANSGQVTPAPATYVGCADNAPPTIPGSGIRMYRTNTAAASGGTALGWNGVTPYNFFDAVVENSPDLTQLTTNVGSCYGANEPVIAVANAGRYIVSLRFNIASVTCSSGAVSICPGVIRYNSAGTEVERKLFPSTGFFVNGFGGQYNCAFFGGTEVIGCQAGDYLLAAWFTSPGANGLGALSALTFNGESSGAYTYFEVTLANWSYN